MILLKKYDILYIGQNDQRKKMITDKQYKFLESLSKQKGYASIFEMLNEWDPSKMATPRQLSSKKASFLIERLLELPDVKIETAKEEVAKEEEATDKQISYFRKLIKKHGIPDWYQDQPSHTKSEMSEIISRIISENK